MKRLEVTLFIDYNEEKTTNGHVLFLLDTAIDDTIGAVVKRVDLIDEIEID